MKKSNACLIAAITICALATAAALSALLVSIMVCFRLKQGYNILDDIITFGISTIVLFVIIFVYLCYNCRKNRL